MHTDQPALFRRSTMVWFLPLLMLPCTTLAAAELTPQQKQALILRPEHYDVMHGKVDRISLNGWWRFKGEVNVLKKEGAKLVCPDESRECPQTDPGLEKGYPRPDYDAAGWREVPVPWKSWNEAPGERDRQPFAGVGYYRTRFRVPADRAGKRVFLCLASVQTECWLWVNGRPAGHHRNPTGYAGKPWSFNQRLWLDDFEFDITPLVTLQAPNTLVLRVFDNGLPITYDRMPDDGGIAGPVDMEFREPIHATEILVAPDLKASAVKLALKLANYTETPRKVQLAAEFLPFHSKDFTPPAKDEPRQVALGTVSLPAGASPHRFTIPFKNPVLWDVRQPFLYHLRLLADGRCVGQTRFGFRELTVNGTRFHLNGHPLYLKGLNGITPPHLRAFNHQNWLRHALRLLKEMNVTLIRVHSGPETQTYYDLLDEQGFISQDDYSPSSSDMKKADIQRDEKIAEVDTASLLDKDSRLKPELQRPLRRWVSWLHNHPSVCMLTGGNELGTRGGRDEAIVAGYLNGFYDFVKAHDLQQRPVTPSSGLCVWDWHTPVKADYYDNHAYPCWRMGWPDSVRGNWERRNDWVRIYGQVDKPNINGECVGWATRATGRRDIRALFDKDGRLDKAAYVKWANTVSGSEESVASHWDWLARQYVRFAGIRAAADSRLRSQATARLTAHMVRLSRRDMDWYEGFALHDIHPEHFGFSAGELERPESDLPALYEKAREHAEFTTLRAALAPQYVALDMYDRNRFAGAPLETGLYVINDLYRSGPANLDVRLDLEDARGRVLNRQHIPFPALEEHARLRKDVVVPLPADLPTGDYTLRAVLTDGTRPVNEQASPLFVLARADANPPIRTTKRIALYEQAAADGTPLARILNRLGLRAGAVMDFAGLAAHDVLIIGPNSLDDRADAAADAVRAWLQRGGQLICFEQKRKGEIPFLKPLRYDPGQVFAADRYFADVIEREHPVMAGLTPEHWELWNGPRPREEGVLRAHAKAVYHCPIFPMTEGVIVAGSTGHRYGKKTSFFGMIACEEKVGRGLVFLSQALAVQRYDTDSVARRYVNNVLQHTLGER
ncbi:MAG: hypothetical protein JXR37_21580 [Kiritimatiellae bacterium]|nr:hypothetical protein [Kiritimatiellia bacterium]